MEEEVEVEQRLRVERTQDLGEVMQQQKQRRRDRASVVWCCFCVVERSGAQCSAVQRSVAQSSAGYSVVIGSGAEVLLLDASRCSLGVGVGIGWRNRVTERLSD